MRRKNLARELLHRQTCDLVLAFCMLAIVCSLIESWWSIDSNVALAQSSQRNLALPSLEPDPRGWQNFQNTNASPQSNDLSIPPIDKNSLTTAFDRLPKPAPQVNPLTSDFLPNEIRSQIGLATYEQVDSSSVGVKQGLDQPEPSQTGSNESEIWPTGIPEPRELLLSPGGIQSTLKFSLLLGALSLAPAIILMTTCYIRVIVVLSLLKQAFGGQQLPPAQVITALSIFLTLLIMAPVWNEVKTKAIDPYAAEEIPWEQAWNQGVEPVKQFMARQIEMAGNESSVAVFYRFSIDSTGEPTPIEMPEYLHEVPINVLIPAFMISELKIAFLLGFQIYLPFLVLDLVVSSVSVSMGMFMLPPQLISFPLKLILFVMVDGWSLVIGMLLQSFIT